MGDFVGVDFAGGHFSWRDFGVDPLDRLPTFLKNGDLNPA